MDNRLILTITNIDELKNNNEILNKTPGEKNIYCSVDSAQDKNSTNLDKILLGKFVDSLTPNGLHF